MWRKTRHLTGVHEITSPEHRDFSIEFVDFVRIEYGELRCCDIRSVIPETTIPCNMFQVCAISQINEYHSVRYRYFRYLWNAQSMLDKGIL